MAGFPFSGKTYVVQRLIELCPIFQTEFGIIITPTAFRPDDFDKMSEQAKRDINIAAWECSLDLLKEKIAECDSRYIIIYDTSCASLIMQPYFELAKQKHRTIYAFINTNNSMCEQRAQGYFLPKEVIAKYKNNFKISIPVLSKLVNKTVVINNHVEETPNLNVLVREITDASTRIHQS
jgi:adenylate kinase family enzyme